MISCFILYLLSLTFTCSEPRPVLITKVETRSEHGNIYPIVSKLRLNIMKL
jgi:hypothetical protein